MKDKLALVGLAAIFALPVKADETLKSRLGLDRQIPSKVRMSAMLMGTHYCLPAYPVLPRFLMDRSPR
jgi:hypothetical protein